MRTLRPALLAIASDFHQEERELFSGRAAWKPLDPAWAVRKAARGFGARTLILTGNLERSLENPSGKWSVQEVGDANLVVGTRDPVAHLHQAGTRKMSARPVVQTTPEQERRWSGLLHDWLMSGG